MKAKVKKAKSFTWITAGNYLLYYYNILLHGMQQIRETIRLFADGPDDHRDKNVESARAGRLPDNESKITNTISNLYFFSCFYFCNGAGTICRTAGKTINLI